MAKRERAQLRNPDTEAKAETWTLAAALKTTFRAQSQASRKAPGARWAGVHPSAHEPYS